MKCNIFNEWSGGGRINVQIPNAPYNAWQNLYSTTVMQVGKWYDIMVTYDNGTARLYVNGVMEDEKTGWSVYV